MIKFCTQCGGAASYLIPAGDNRMRAVCSECGHIEYQNPKLITGTLCVYKDKVMLCKRAIEPRYGLWTLPAGFMELQETCEQAALRETAEEALAYPELKHLYTMISLPHIGQVYLIYLAELSAEEFGAGEESLEVGLFNQSEIPWDLLAFKTVRQTLELYWSDYSSGTFPFRRLTIDSK